LRRHLVKITVQLPVDRDGIEVEANLSVEDVTGIIVLDVPTVARKPKVIVRLGRSDLDNGLNALDRLTGRDPGAASYMGPDADPEPGDPGEEPAAESLAD
jgi:hypothetical protein